MTRLSDPELLHLLYVDKAPAIWELQMRYGAAMQNFAQGRLGSYQLAQEAVSDVFVSLWKKPVESFTSIQAVRNYLYTATAFRCEKMDKSMRHRKAQQTALVQFLAPDISVDMEREILEAEVTARLEQQIELSLSKLTMLPARMRQILIMTFAHDLKPAQIAQRLNISVRSVRNQKAKALAMLRGWVADVAAMEVDLTAINKVTEK